MALNKKKLIYFLAIVAFLIQYANSSNAVFRDELNLLKKKIISQDVSSDEFKQKPKDVPIRPIETKEEWKLPHNNSTNKISDKKMGNQRYYLEYEQCIELSENMRKDHSNINENNICAKLVGVSKEPICQNYKPVEPKVSLPGDCKEASLPRNCKEVQASGQNISGIYEILPIAEKEPVKVLCDMETKSGGWTYIQRRFDGSEDFFREWRDYKFGFGNLQKEFWIGLEHIYHLTGFETNELLVEVVDKDKVKAYAQYNIFGIGPEIEGYPLSTLKGFTGDAGDSLALHLGQKFSTKDFDQDNSTTLNCAEFYLGAWWFNSCYNSNLNGKFINVRAPTEYINKGMNWFTFRRSNYFLSESRMLVRPNF